MRPAKPVSTPLPLRLWRFSGSALLNLLLCLLLAGYLSPLAYMLLTSVKQPEQISAGVAAPLYPAVNPKYAYQGVDYPIVQVPTTEGVKDWALVTKRLKYSEFIDPQHPEKGLIHWDGSWYGLKKVFVFSLSFNAFAAWWKANLLEGALYTLIVLAITEIAVLATSIAVAYGFSRFRIPGGKWLFLLLIATMLIPDSITLLPTYLTYVNILYIWLPHQPVLRFPFPFPWNWLPLIVPHFFGNAIFIFLLRQNFLSIPRDLDEAAMLDGAGPLRILVSVVLPQCVPAVATVAMLQFFYIWNELRTTSLYMRGVGTNFRLLSALLQSAEPKPGISPEALLQSSALLMIIVPILVLLLFQRFFMQDVAVTGTEK